MVDRALSRHELVCRSLDEIDSVAREIVNYAQNVKIWLFEGEMGAGKTTLIKAVCRCFNVGDTVNSPTFSIVNEYRNPQKDVFYHFDFYRIKDENEALDIGVDEYFDSGSFCFIEWPSKIENLLPEEVLKIDISIGDNDLRVIELSLYE